MALVLFTVGAFLSAAVGGILALRVTRFVGFVIAFGAGIRVGAAFFDLIPESIELLAPSIELAMLSAALGFLVFYVLEKLTLLHIGHEAATELDHEEAAHRHVGLIGAAGTTVHSMLDGAAVAASLQAGAEIGLVIAIVIIVHRFSDGIGIVSLLLANRVSQTVAYRWVAIVGIAPVVGVLVAGIVPIPEEALGALLGVFAGFFLYIGAAELLPEAHRADRSPWIIAATILGAAGIVTISRALGVAV